MKRFWLAVSLIGKFLISKLQFDTVLSFQGFPPKSKNLNSAVFEEVKLLANGGDPKSQNKLDWMYDQGLGTIKKPKEAAKWYLRWAKQGFKQV